MITARDIINEAQDDLRQKAQQTGITKSEVDMIANTFHQSLEKGVKKEIVLGNAGGVEELFTGQEIKGGDAERVKKRVKQDYLEKRNEAAKEESGDSYESDLERVADDLFTRLQKGFQASDRQDNFNGVLNYLEFESDQELMNQLDYYLNKEVSGDMDVNVGTTGRVTSQGFTPPDNKFIKDKDKGK